MSGYVSGEQTGDEETIKLNTNENPYPPAPAISDVIRSFDISKLRRYPPANADHFRDLAAEIHDVQRGNIIATRGGDELLRLMITTFVDPGQPIGVTEPTYSLYPVLAQIQNCPVAKVPLNNNWLPPKDFAKQLNDAGAPLSFLVNPHAPSGVLMDPDSVARIADELDGLLLLDEAYIDFVEPEMAYNSVPLIQSHDNVVILRTLSKGYSLAGLRLGYGIGPEALIKPMLEKTRDSYNLDWLSQEIACAALQHRDHARLSWDKVRQERTRVSTSLRKLGFEVIDSSANFILVTIGAGGAKTLYESLKQQNMLVRYFDHPGLQDKLRISVGTGTENDRLLALMAELAATDA
jgi:histidinol-phosphate aminotransferase